MKGLFTIGYEKEQMDAIRALGTEIDIIKEAGLIFGTPVADYDFLVCFDPFEKLDFTNHKLQWIQLVSKGIAHVPEHIIRSGISVTNNKNASAIPIAETVIGYLLSICKCFSEFGEQKKAGIWKFRTDLLELYGKTIGFLGTGEIASETAKRLRAFGTRILGMNRSGKKADGFDEIVLPDASDFLLRTSDIVISALPSTPETRHFLNARTLGFMKKGSILINISRGEIIDEVALYEYLKQGHFKGVALDVFETEPLSSRSPLWKSDRLLLTPHNSFFSDNYKARLFQMVYDNVASFLQGKELRNLVDFTKGY